MEATTISPKEALYNKAKDMGLKVNTKMTKETLENMISEAKKAKEKPKVAKDTFRDEY